jgi:manganese/iron transport system permease protein/iron/zinc/copper transport system permease protein
VLAEPFEYEFFRHGLYAATLVGALTGLMGVFVVLRRMSYIGHGLSHSIFGGAVVSYVLSVNFYLGAGLWGFASALLINATARRSRVGADAAIGIITTASFALGVALISRYRTFTRNFEAALFGNILGVTVEDIFVIAAVSAMVGVLMFIFYKQMLFTTFDPEVAPSYGVSTAWIDTLFALMLAGTIIVSIQIMGVTLIAAGLVIPPVTARLLTDSFNRMIVLSTVIGAFTGFAGLYTSYYADVASGAMIVLVAAGLFVVAMAYNTLRHRTFSFGPSLAPAPARARAEDAHLFD